MARNASMARNTSMPRNASTARNASLPRDANITRRTLTALLSHTILPYKQQSHPTPWAASLFIP